MTRWRSRPYPPHRNECLCPTSSGLRYVVVVVVVEVEVGVEVDVGVEVVVVIEVELRPAWPPHLMGAACKLVNVGE